MYRGISCCKVEVCTEVSLVARRRCVQRYLLLQGGGVYRGISCCKEEVCNTLGVGGYTSQ